MSLTTNDFWSFPESSKIDILYTRKDLHKKRIVQALRDRQTLIEKQDTGMYTFYGDEQALLVICEDWYFTVLIDFYRLLF